MDDMKGKNDDKTSGRKKPLWWRGNGTFFIELGAWGQRAGGFKENVRCGGWISSLLSRNAALPARDCI
jgi:hypothetical protein